jgi:hypothetical protein
MQRNARLPSASRLLPSYPTFRSQERPLDESPKALHAPRQLADVDLDVLSNCMQHSKPHKATLRESRCKLRLKCPALESVEDI